jgi:transposase-like protein
MNQQMTKKQKAFEDFNFEIFKEEVIEKLQKGGNLGGVNGIFSDLMQRFINAALEGEITSQIREDVAKGRPNRRNGYTQKTLRSEYGPIEISPPRDREGNFEPQVVKKWDRSIGTGLNEQILMLYAYGNSYSDIQQQIKKIYGVELSSNVIAEVTSSVYSQITEWHERQLQSLYAVLFFDGIYFNSREGGKSQKRVIYSVYAVDAEGNRDVLGLYIKGSESAIEWGKVMSDLKKRGIEDVLFICIDGLKGLSESIAQEFPQAIVQRCIVHKVRNSVKFVNEKDKKPVCQDLKSIYSSSDITHAEIALDAFKEKWDTIYPEISKLWQKDWTEVTNFLEYGESIRRLIYTTNPVEALHRQIRKVTKTKGQWPNDKSLTTQIYLILMHGKGGWRKKVFNWVKIARELAEAFGERFTKHISN